MMKSKTKKPDFMDMDRDGDRKEPMKKAVAKAKPAMKVAVKGLAMNKTAKMPKPKAKKK